MLTRNCNLRYVMMYDPNFFMQSYVPACDIQEIRLGFGPFVLKQSVGSYVWSPRSISDDDRQQQQQTTVVNPKVCWWCHQLCMVVGQSWICSDKYGCCKVVDTKYAQFVKKVTGQSTPRQENGLHQGALRTRREHSASEIAFNKTTYALFYHLQLLSCCFTAMLWHMN